MIFSNFCPKIPKESIFCPKFKYFLFFHETLHNEEFKGTDFKNNKGFFKFQPKITQVRCTGAQKRCLKYLAKLKSDSGLPKKKCLLFASMIVLQKW